MTLHAVKCRYCGQSASRLIAVALLQDLGCETNNPADSCFARHEDGEPSLPHDFTELAQPIHRAKSHGD